MKREHTSIATVEDSVQGQAARRFIDAAIIVLLIITGWRLLSLSHRPADDTGRASALTPAIKPGDMFRLPDVAWAAPRTVVLIVSSTCPACNDNLPFYGQVAALATEQTGVVAVSAEPEAIVGSWLREHHVAVQEIYRLKDLSAHGLTMTPMVLIVDAQGRVTDLMIKRLTQSDQAMVLERVRSPGAPALDNSKQIRELSTHELAAMSTRGDIQMLDVRTRETFQRGHRDGARNIPSRELGARALLEADSRIPVIIDCLAPGAASYCRSAAWELVDAGFSDVAILIR